MNHYRSLSSFHLFGSQKLCEWRIPKTITRRKIINKKKIQIYTDFVDFIWDFHFMTLILQYLYKYKHYTRFLKNSNACRRLWQILYSLWCEQDLKYYFGKCVQTEASAVALLRQLLRIQNLWKIRKDRWYVA